MHVLVTGATGFVGSHLVPALRDAGHEVRALVRDRTAYDPPAGVEAVEGDLLDPASLPDALAGVDAAVYLVHSMHAGSDYDDRDRRAAEHFRDAADAAGLDRILYLGALGCAETPLSPHLASRRSVEHILADADCDLTALRAAIVVGRGSAGFRLICQVATRFPVVPAPRAIHTECQPIAIDDVVAYLAGALETPATAGETYEIGGPEVMPYADLLRRAGDILAGRAPRIVVVPGLTPRLAATLVGWVTDVPASVARPLVEGLDQRVVADDDRIQEHLPVRLTPYTEAVLAVQGEHQRPAATAKPAIDSGANG